MKKDETFKQPWLKFFPSDWRSDPALRMCSLAARGLWIEMISLMHEADEYGSLIVNGRSLNAQQLAVMIGSTKSHVEKLVLELEEAGVFSRDESRVIYSRRMKRDHERSTANRERGKLGGNPKLKGQDNPPHNPDDNQPHKPRDKQTNAIKANGVKQDVKSEDNRADKREDIPRARTAAIGTRSQKPEREERASAASKSLEPPREKAGCADEELTSFRNSITKAFVSSGCTSGPDTTHAEIWIAQGFSAALCLAVIREKLVGRKTVTSLGYFDSAIAEAHAKRAPPDATTPPASSDETPDPIIRLIDCEVPKSNLIRVIERWKETKFWIDPWGWPPNDPDCKVPHDILRECGLEPYSAEVVRLNR